MENRCFKRFGTLFISCAAFIYANAQISDNYYASLKGKKGAELKTAVHNLIKDAKVLDYGSGSGKTWEGFYTTDRTEDNQVIDRYSNDTRYFGNKGASVSGMNIEHSFPKSWWGGSENQAYKDLYNLMPSEQKINSAKSNYPMGKVTTASTDNGCTKVGTGSNGYKLWEPADKWKGDFARGYMYMATAYQNFTWSGTQASQILQQGAYPTLREWAYKLYIEWAKADKPDEQEVKRNNEVNKIQGNRNPFIDFPNLMEYIWGDSIDYAFNPETTVKSSDFHTGDVETTNTIYEENFRNSNSGNCTISNISGNVSVWTLDNTYGWKGTAFHGKCYAAEAMLITPEMDLTQYKSATMQFSHALNKLEDPENTVDKYMSVEILCDGVTTKLEGINWPSGKSWAFVNSGTISLTAYAGKKINVVFHYTSTDSYAGTWQIESLNISGIKKPASDINKITTNDNYKLDLTQPYTAYSIDGRHVNHNTYKGIMIIIQNGKTWKLRK